MGNAEITPIPQQPDHVETSPFGHVTAEKLLSEFWQIRGAIVPTAALSVWQDKFNVWMLNNPLWGEMALGLVNPKDVFLKENEMPTAPITKVGFLYNQLEMKGDARTLVHIRRVLRACGYRYTSDGIVRNFEWAAHRANKWIGESIKIYKLRTYEPVSAFLDLKNTMQEGTDQAKEALEEWETITSQKIGYMLSKEEGAMGEVQRAALHGRAGLVAVFLGMFMDTPSDLDPEKKDSETGTWLYKRVRAISAILEGCGMEIPKGVGRIVLLDDLKAGIKLGRHFGINQTTGK